MVSTMKLVLFVLNNLTLKYYVCFHTYLWNDKINSWYIRDIIIIIENKVCKLCSVNKMVMGLLDIIFCIYLLLSSITWSHLILYLSYLFFSSYHYPHSTSFHLSLRPLSNIIKSCSQIFLLWYLIFKYMLRHQYHHSQPPSNHHHRCHHNDDTDDPQKPPSHPQPLEIRSPTRPRPPRPLFSKTLLHYLLRHHIDRHHMHYHN